ncbi:MAG: hypothetical protein Q4P13_06690, partial [Psychrobacter sp.]|nr:hypothetical protein [Psychrobacter sp.]
SACSTSTDGSNIQPIQDKSSTTHNTTGITKPELAKPAKIDNSPIHEISANILATDCAIKDERFNTLSFLKISNLLQIKSAINSDLNHDKRNDNIVLVSPSSALNKACDSSDHYNKDSFKLIADVSGQVKPIITNLGVEYISGATLSAVPNGFVFSNEIGQSIKCQEEAIFKISGNEIYLNKVRTICAIPDSDIDWQERAFEKSAATLLQNVDLSTAFDGLRDVFLNKDFRIKKSGI